MSKPHVIPLHLLRKKAREKRDREDNQLLETPDPTLVNTHQKPKTRTSFYKR